MTFDSGSPQVDIKQFDLVDEPTVARLLNANDFGGAFSGFEAESVEMAKRLLPLAAAFSVAPISGFHVGAIAVGASGSLYLGANMEFVGVPLSASLHAEQSAVLNAWYHGEAKIESLVVSAAPCGHCRQFLWELPGAGSVRLVFEKEITDLATLLPCAFGAERSEGRTLLDSPSCDFEAIASVDSELVERAIDAARASYAPYTEAPEGVALKCIDGRIFSGRTVESIAFNPTVSAVVAALNQRNFSQSRGVEINAIAHAKLAESLADQLDFTKSLMKPFCAVSIQSFDLSAS
jgi:cytidine deaminase